MKYKIEELKGKKVAVRTPTEEDFWKFVDASGERREGFWNWMKERAVDLFHGFGYDHEQLSWYQRNGYEIIPFSDVIFPQDLKVGDVVEEIKYPVIQYSYLASNYGESLGSHDSKEELGTPYTIKEMKGEYFVPVDLDLTMFKLSDFKKVEEEKPEEQKQSTEQTMRKEFTVSGSIPLKEALIKELGYKTYNSQGIGISNIGPVKDGKDLVQDWFINLETHYTLPKDYDRAIEAFRDYYATPQFKAGDYVVIDSVKRTALSSFHVGGVYQLSHDLTENDFSVERDDNNRKNGYSYLGVTKDIIFRAATPVEITEYNKPKETILTLGTTNTKVVIKKNSVVIQGPDGNKSVDVPKLRNFDKQLHKDGDIGEYNTYIQEDVRFIRIGCATYNCLVSPAEIRTVLSELDKIK